jgi:hypothetical protein
MSISGCNRYRHAAATKRPSKIRVHMRARAVQLLPQQIPDLRQRSVRDDATRPRRLRNEVEQRREPKVILAHAALVIPAFS